jgi:tetratricopeptide (TPR) repeat protein
MLVVSDFIKQLESLIVQGEVDRAREFLDSTRELAENEKQFWYGGFLFLREEHLDVALEYAEIGRKRFPEVLRFRSLLGVILSRLERFEEARVELEAACEIRIPKILVNSLSCVYLGLEDFEAGEKFHARSREQEPDCSERLEDYASFLHDRGFILIQKYRRYDEALSLFQRAESLSPSDHHIQYGLGCSLWKLERYSEAAVHLEKATNWPPAWAALACVYNETGQFEKALDASRKAIEHFSSQTRIFEERARAARGLSLVEVELEALLDALKLSPDEGSIKVDLGLAYYKHGDCELALEILSEAIEVGFEDKEDKCLAHWARALTKAALLDETAILDFDLAIALEPDAPGLKLAKAGSQNRLGRHEEALETLEGLLETMPDHEKARRLYTNLLNPDDVQ